MFICIRQTNGKGRGVFAMKAFFKGDTIEQAPVILIPANQLGLIQKTVLNHYYYEWGENDNEAAIVLGYGSLYNHSYQPNATYTYNLEDEQILEYIALRDILPGEEITINYNGETDIDSPLSFDVVN